jgi:predicted secreted Zn-dependent protease
LTRGEFHALALAGLALAGAIASGPAGAEVRSITNLHSYHVIGSTSADLIASLRNNPFHGPNGPALANIRPTYSMALDTKQTGGTCSVANVKLDMTFDVTLPAATEGLLAADARYAWRTFSAFAKRHEETHREIYVDCAKDFVAEAQKLTTTSGCDSLKAQATRLLDAENQACNLRQQAFDRVDGPRVLGLALFKSIAGAGMTASATPIGDAGSASLAPQ